MKNVNSQRIRSLLKRGTKALAITSVLLAVASCSHGKTDTDNSNSKLEVTTTCTTSTTTSTETTSTTSSTSTSTSTTTMEQTTTMIITTASPNVQESFQVIETQPEPVVYAEPTNLPITERERVLLCNVVANEYGSDWVSVYDKACIVATVMNRVNNAQFPNDIESVLTQPYQFSGYWASDSYYSTVTDSCVEAVNYYFEHPEEFGSYLYFEGDGQRNFFH